jgi:general secretion pathway protein M
MKLPAEIQVLWDGATPRDRRLAGGAVALLTLALLWWVGLAPALGALNVTAQQRVLLDVQMEQMQGLQLRATSLQALPPVNTAESTRLLEASLKPLGEQASWTIAGGRATIKLTGMPADALAQWLAQVRQNARIAPEQAHLTRNAEGAWDGTLVLTLP